MKCSGHQQAVGTAGRLRAASAVFRSGTPLVTARPCRRPAPQTLTLTQAILGINKPSSKQADSSANGASVDSTKAEIIRKLEYIIGASKDDPKAKEAYQAVALSVREDLLERFNKTQEFWKYAVCLVCTSKDATTNQRRLVNAGRHPSAV